MTINHESSTFSQPDTLRILAILVEFQLDADEKTTGDGKFMLSPSEDAIIDPPPHDTDYFQNQLLTLSNYYKKVSNEKLILVGTVSPQIITLNREMGYYNPGTTEEALDQGLAELFRDAIRAADSSGVHFSGYDAFIIFHAGVGRDVELGWDATPKDIPSVFLNLDDLRKHVSGNDPSYPGISVEKGKFFVQEGILLPETESQDGYEIGLLGTAALMFGFQLGLPAMWDTQTGRSGIGRWGLMDQGSGNFSGLIPAEPCAFSKIFLGWEKPIEKRQGDRLPVACSSVKQGTKIYKIPISEKEYFLVENRMHDPNGDGVAYGWDASGNRVQFTPEGEIKSDKPFGVIVRVDEYDFGLPGSGILIWHVDETVIEANLKENKINSDKNHRGVDLEEADGAQDIGEIYGMLDGGAGSETGVMQDAWYADNEINKLVNGKREVLFTPDSHPNSRANSGDNSHIVISGFSKNDTVMTFSVSTDLIHEGFPQYFTGGLHLYPPLSGDLDGDGQIELAVVAREGKLFAWKQNGSKVIQNLFVHKRIDVAGDTLLFPLALYAESAEGISVPPVIGGLDSGNRREIVCAATGNRLMDWSADDSNRDGLADLRVDTTFAENAITELVLGNRQLFIGTEKGIFSSPIQEPHLSSAAICGISQFELAGKPYLVAVEQNGMVHWIAWPAPAKPIAAVFLRSGETVNHLAVGSLHSDNVFIFLLTNQRGFVFDTSGAVLGQWDNTVFPDSLSAPALGDLDQDGALEIVTTAKGQVWAFNTNGSLVDYFPIPQTSRSVTLSSPVLGDADGDGQIEVIVTTSEGAVEAYRKDGSMAEGFPLAIGGKSPVAPILLDLDGDQGIELAAVSEDGSVMVWDLRGTWDMTTAPWPGYLHDSGHTASNRQALENTAPGKEWMPSRLVYNYPNPNIENYTTIRYRLEQPAEVKICIFNMAGDRVKEMEGPGIPQTENEVVWNLDHVGSGIYFCKVSARGEYEEKTVVFKIAVVK